MLTAFTYAEEGVRFVFDKARIANYTYIWNDGTEVKAELRNNDTELWIKGELAATIVNHKANLLNCRRADVQHQVARSCS